MLPPSVHTATRPEPSVIAVPPSLLRWPAWARVVCVLAMVALLWLATAWALQP